MNFKVVPSRSIIVFIIIVEHYEQQKQTKIVLKLVVCLFLCCVVVRVGWIKKKPIRKSVQCIGDISDFLVIASDEE